MNPIASAGCVRSRATLSGRGVRQAPEAGLEARARPGGADCRAPRACTAPRREGGPANELADARSTAVPDVRTTQPHAWIPTAGRSHGRFRRDAHESHNDVPVDA